jgi:cyclic pyranopterin phosphate synthase
MRTEPLEHDALLDGGQAVRLLDGREPLTDGHNRLIGDVRISVTDRCNFRCQYCMPAEGLPWLEHDKVLTFEEIARLVEILAAIGVHDVRLTGGEPLVRRDFPRLAAMLAGIDRVHDLSVTTNGYLLERDAAALVDAGINRFNVSIDSLQRDRFFQMTRRDALPRVLRGLEALAAHPEAHPIKINAVGLRGFTEEEILPMARFARENPYEVRFIEFMPLDADRSWNPDLVLPGEEIRAAIDAVYPLEPEPREPSATARVYRFADGQGRIGFINPVSDPFCGDCNRIRITSEGKLRTCLFSLHETDLRTPMREGASDAEVEEVIRDAVWRKELKHRVNEPGYRQPARSMSQIGG